MVSKQSYKITGKQDHAPAQEALPNLDLLRAVAVLLVFVDHTINMLLYHNDGEHNLLAWAGRLGVLFFFVHTCCVLMMSLERHKGRHLFAKFYVRRVFRIYPLSIIAVAIVAAFGINRSITGLHLLANLLLIQNLTFSPNAFGSMWTLPLEVQMYVLLPFIYVVITRFRGWWIPLAMFAAAIPLALLQPHYVARASVLAFVPAFLPGVIAYQGFRRRHLSLPSFGFPILLVVVAALFLVHPGWELSAWFSCLFLGAAAPLFAQIGSSEMNRITYVVAKYSYGIYLSHSLLLSAMTLSWKTLPLYVAVVVIASIGSYHLIERPMIKLGNRLTRSQDLEAHDNFKASLQPSGTEEYSAS